MQEGTYKGSASESAQNLSQVPSPMDAQYANVGRLDSMRDEQLNTGAIRTPTKPLHERKHSPATLVNMQLRSSFG